MKKMIFLGGTVGKNNWREDFIEYLKLLGIKDSEIFNPIVTLWDDSARAHEEEMKRKCSHHLFYIGNPAVNVNRLSAYSMVEATMSLYDKLHTTVVVFDHDQIGQDVANSLKQAEYVLRVRHPQAKIVNSLTEAGQMLAKDFVFLKSDEALYFPEFIDN